MKTAIWLFRCRDLITIFLRRSVKVIGLVKFTREKLRKLIAAEIFISMIWGLSAFTVSGGISRTCYWKGLKGLAERWNPRRLNICAALWARLSIFSILFKERHPAPRLFQVLIPF